MMSNAIEIKLNFLVITAGVEFHVQALVCGDENSVISVMMKGLKFLYNKLKQNWAIQKQQIFGQRYNKIAIVSSYHFS